MKVVYGDRDWFFEDSQTVGELLERTGLKREPVLVMLDGKLVDRNYRIPADGKVLIINAANGG